MEQEKNYAFIDLIKVKRSTGNKIRKNARKKIAYSVARDVDKESFTIQTIADILVEINKDKDKAYFIDWQVDHYHVLNQPIRVKYYAIECFINDLYGVMRLLNGYKFECSIRELHEHPLIRSLIHSFYHGS